MQSWHRLGALKGQRFGFAVRAVYARDVLVARERAAGGSARPEPACRAGVLTGGRAHDTVVVIVPELLDGLGSVWLAVAVKFWTTVPAAVMVTPTSNTTLPPRMLIPPNLHEIVEPWMLHFVARLSLLSRGQRPSTGKPSTKSASTANSALARVSGFSPATLTPSKQ